MFSALLRDDASNLGDTISLGQSGYRIAPHHLKDEGRLLKALRKLHDNADPVILPADFLAKRKQGFIDNKKSRMDFEELDEQASAVFDALPQPNALTIVTGPPGAAKTTVTSLWINLTEEIFPSLPVVLITKERPALHRLQDKMNLRNAVTFTLDEALDDKTSFPAQSCIIVDEASLLGTRAMAVMLEKAANAKARRMILIGDDKQLFPDDVGQPFRWLRENNKGHVVALTSSFRQKTTDLRQLVETLHRGDIKSAIDALHINFVNKHDILPNLRRMLEDRAPDKTLVIVHGDEFLIDRLKIVCPGFRIYSLAASQGLAVDNVILVIAKQMNLSELLVGCSRQRFMLDVVVDQGIYMSKEAMQNNVADYPRSLMAMDVLGEDNILELLTGN